MYNWRLILKTISLLCLTTAVSALAQTSAQDHHKALGPFFNAAPFVAKPSGPKLGLDSIHRWNQIAIDASGLDHTPVGPGETRVFGEQLGPGRSSRAMAIVHIAIFDAVDAIVQRYQSYIGVQAGHGAVSLDAAVAQAAHDTLVPLYPSQAANFDSFLADDLAKINNVSARLEVSILVNALPPQFWRCESPTAPNSLNQMSVLIISRAICPAIGGRIRSVLFRSRLVHIGVRASHS